MMERDVRCRGCATAANCEVSVTKHDEVCPCVECLVKTMCDTLCPDFENYVVIHNSIGVVR